MEKFGCIGPYYNNKEHICTNLTQSKKIKKMYTNGKKYYQKCLHPCKYLHLQLSQTLEGRVVNFSHLSLLARLREMISISRE